MVTLLKLASGWLVVVLLGYLTANNVAASQIVRMPVEELPAAANAPRTPQDSMGGEKWRYKYQNGHWWYWLPTDQWVFWNGSSWITYTPEAYAEFYVTLQPPAPTQNYVYDDPGYSAPVYGGPAYDGRRYWDGGYYANRYYGPGYYNYGAGPWAYGYGGGWGAPYVYGNRGAATGAGIGSAIGGAVGGYDGAAVGAGIGAAIGASNDNPRNNRNRNANRTNRNDNRRRGNNRR